MQNINYNKLFPENDFLSFLSSLCKCYYKDSIAVIDSKLESEM